MVLVFVGHAKLSLPGAPENVHVCLEDSSVVDDEDVFSALPVNTCLMLPWGETHLEIALSLLTTQVTQSSRDWHFVREILFYENPPKGNLFRFVLTFCLNVWMCDVKIEKFGREIMP